jgi:hypothetical protein
MNPANDQRVRGVPRAVQLALFALLIGAPVVLRLSGAGWPPLFALAIIGMLILVMLGQSSEPEIVVAFAATVALAEWVSAIGPAVDGYDTLAHAQLSAGLVPVALVVAAALGRWRQE